MERLLELYLNPNLKKDFELYFEFVKIGYLLNVNNGPLGDNTSRTEELFEKDYAQFVREVFNFMNPSS